MVSLRLPPLPTVQDIVRLYRLSAIKQLSQNFLMNDKLTDKIVKCTGKINNAQVLEVGPGPGAITRSIIRKCPKRLIVIEKDKRFKPTLHMLKDAFSTINGQMEVVFNDILDVDLNNVFEEEEKREWDDRCPNIYLLGNLPFKISTPLVLKWLHDIAEKRNAWSNGRVQMTLTFQKEVAERLVADVGENQRCRLSIMAQTWTIPKLRFIIPGNAFVPKPEVDVGVVSFTPLIKPRTRHEFHLFEKVNRHMFSFRQKYCIKCARTLFPPDCQEQLSTAMLKLADVDPNLRPFNLSVEDMNKLTTAYKYLCEKHPEIVKYNYRASRKVLSRKYLKSVNIQEYVEDNKNYQTATSF